MDTNLLHIYIWWKDMIKCYTVYATALSTDSPHIATPRHTLYHMPYNDIFKTLFFLEGQKSVWNILHSRQNLSSIWFIFWQCHGTFMQ